MKMPLNCLNMIHQSSHISDKCAIGAFLSFIGLPNCGGDKKAYAYFRKPGKLNNLLLSMAGKIMLRFPR